MSNRGKAAFERWQGGERRDTFLDAARHHGITVMASRSVNLKNRIRLDEAKSCDAFTQAVEETTPVDSTRSGGLQVDDPGSVDVRHHAAEPVAQGRFLWFLLCVQYAF